MSAESIIKSQARGILKQNYVRAIMALLIICIPFAIIDGTTTVISCLVPQFVTDEMTSMILVYSIGYPVEVILGLLFSPIINGYIRAFYKAAYTEKIDMKDVFFYFGSGHYIDALGLNVRLILRMLLPTLILFSPLIAYGIITSAFAPDFAKTVIYYDFYFILAVLSTITTVLYSLRYFTVFTVSADNPDFSPKQVFQYNKYIMKNRTGSAAKLIFSFTPWILLCLLILPMLYVIPYMTQSLCVSAKWMTKAALEENK